MNESTSELKSRMMAAAERLRKLECWEYPETTISESIERMRDGGEAGNEAWVWLLKRMVALPPERRDRAEKYLSEYQQTIGRWFIAENHDRLSKSPFPHHQAPAYAPHAS